jgi:hypothetical protein
MFAITADLLEAFGLKQLKKQSQLKAGSRRRKRKCRTSRSHLSWAAEADGRQMRAVAGLRLTVGAALR